MSRPRGYELFINVSKIENIGKKGETPKVRIFWELKLPGFPTFYSQEDVIASLKDRSRLRQIVTKCVGKKALTEPTFELFDILHTHYRIRLRTR
jgi:hypothetical protein